MDPLADETKWLQMSDIASRLRVSALFGEPAFVACRPILIKGWSIARFYDKERIRVSTDIDVLFCSRESERTLQVIRGRSESIAIDPHFGPRHLDTLSFDELFSRSYEIELEGVPIRVLADEDNLRITAVHWLTDGGVNKEKLWDIYYLVKNRRPGFDWVRCLDTSMPARKTWVMAAIATARDHLDLDVSDLPAEVREFALPGWYEQTLKKEWRLGVYPRRILSTVITRPKLLFEQLRRKLPPNRIAATIDTETAIDATTRIPAQLKSLAKKSLAFVRGITSRLTYSSIGKR
ncbi:MAG: hypothetical protein ABL984_13090 [Pyrinomonadaceae bacterium]